MNCSFLIEYFQSLNSYYYYYFDDVPKVIVILFVLMMVYVDEMEMYNVYNDEVYSIENDIVMLKMNNDQAMEVDIVRKVLMLSAVVGDVMNEMFQTISNQLFEETIFLLSTYISR